MTISPSMNDQREERIEKCRAHVESLLSVKGHEGLRETSYPSNSLNFLKKSRNDHASPAPAPAPAPATKKTSSIPTLKNGSPSLDNAEAKVKLNIIIAGAGLGGLATAIALRRRGHTVTIFEKAPELGEVGAGIQIPPNSARLLLSFGLEPHISTKVTEPDAIHVRRWQDGSILSTTPLRPHSIEKYSAPYYVVHRANLQLALRDLAIDLGVVLHLGLGVKEYASEGGWVVLENEKKYEADLVVAADGIKSEARTVVLGGVEQAPRMAGFAAYRAVVDVEEMKEDPELEWLLEIPGQNLWVGDGRHVMTYTIAGGRWFNMVLSHPETSDPSTWAQDQGMILEEMRNQFKGWDPRLVKLISLIRKTLKWPLLTLAPLERWLPPSSSPKLVLIGDAAHAMVPYMSEGAAMAVEDGSALAEILSHITSPAQLTDALKVYERVRILRSGQMQEASLVNGKLWHFADGPEQRARDEAMKKAEGVEGADNPNQWSDELTASWAYGYDAEKEIREAWMEILGSDAKLR